MARSLSGGEYGSRRDICLKMRRTWRCLQGAGDAVSARCTQEQGNQRKRLNVRRAHAASASAGCYDDRVQTIGYKRFLFHNYRFNVSPTMAERQVSAAPGSGSGADAGRRRLHTLVRPSLRFPAPKALFMRVCQQFPTSTWTRWRCALRRVLPYLVTLQRRLIESPCLPGRGWLGEASGRALWRS